ncbi:MAG: M20/M25/M40 family metallo-hydrolase [Thermodesulfobacteriota bacterium]
MSSFFPINQERLAHYFITLCEIDSPGKAEAKVAAYLIDFFGAFPGVSAFVDDSASVTGSDTGNLVVSLPGTDLDKKPLFFNCHMDVIAPCLGVKVCRHNNIFTSQGDTVLGGDDKAGIAILMEMTQVLFENNLSHCPLEFLFTTGEEIGLLGAKAFDPSLLSASMGFALDSTGVDNVIVGAPAAVYVNAEISGKAAHAGLNPQDGINAITLASRIISRLPMGRLDELSTANVGLVSGGTATNIVPDFVQFQGEIRSHSASLLARHIAAFRKVFTENISLQPNATLPSFSLNFPEQYPAMALADDEPLLATARSAATFLQRELDYIVAGGGSDANVFNSRGLSTAILGVGMENVHSTHELISLDSLVRTLELTVSLATC